MREVDHYCSLVPCGPCDWCDGSYPYPFGSEEQHERVEKEVDQRVTESKNQTGTKERTMRMGRMAKEEKALHVVLSDHALDFHDSKG